MPDEHTLQKLVNERPTCEETENQDRMVGLPYS